MNFKKDLKLRGVTYFKKAPAGSRWEVMATTTQTSTKMKLNFAVSAFNQ
jgi:hypothetical protein